MSEAKRTSSVESDRANKSLAVKKTIKLYIGGAFPRTESGRSVPVNFHGTDKVYGNVCVSSRKDFRNAVEVAEAAQSKWAGATAYNRGQILYRMAEMLEGRRAEFAQLFKDTLGWDAARAEREIQAGIDAFVYYAGFADKYQQIRGAVNPVASAHHCFTTPEPVGVVALVCGEAFSFARLCEDLASLLCGGNSVVAILPLGSDGRAGGPGCPAVLAPLAEVLATSDLPGGVVNLLTGDLKELYKHIAQHMEVRSISYRHDDRKMLAEIQALSVDNMKRVVAMLPENDASVPSLKRITSFVEYKTAWHPVGW